MIDYDFTEEKPKYFFIKTYFGRTCGHYHKTVAGADKCLSILRKKILRFGGERKRDDTWDNVYIQDDLGNKYDRGYIEAYGSLDVEHDEAKWRAENPELYDYCHKF
jgi:hypothetical protein